MATLGAYVHVDGVVYAPGDEVPAHHAVLITNPKAWEGGVLPAAEIPVAGPAAPPRAGKGSGRDEWAAYAAELGLAVGPDASRDDIIAAVDEIA